MFLNIYHPEKIKANLPPFPETIDPIQFSLSLDGRGLG
jgi:hypothetical protein